MLPIYLLHLLPLQLQPENLFLALSLPPDCLSSGFPHLAFRKLVHNSLGRKPSPPRRKAEKPAATLHIVQKQNWLLGVQDEHFVSTYPPALCLAHSHHSYALNFSWTEDVNMESSGPVWAMCQVTSVAAGEMFPGTLCLAQETQGPT